MVDTKYQVALVAHKNISGEAKNVTHRNSICNIKDMDRFNDLLDDQSFYKGSGAWFDMNDRMDIYLGWYKDAIEKKLSEDYEVDIIETHRSYGDEHIDYLIDLEKSLKSDIVVLDREYL